ncbi:uncharacterized protein TM35_000951040 [Trypanosoma theileri]|uniref:Uncharacterized protein n=1 Tax=Trypanosoma theileri TaxID=67003 RepID=A0A1X0NEG7_9TRYP|nr:uncharacterized protein TM35_000951040 [Trypanosoma theileri]ORC82239.1 hypothetical protein TM35_000951040 [Trypanosoma theileri]
MSPANTHPNSSGRKFHYSLSLSLSVHSYTFLSIVLLLAAAHTPLHPPLRLGSSRSAHHYKPVWGCRVYLSMPVGSHHSGRVRGTPYSLRNTVHNDQRSIGNVISNTINNNKSASTTKNTNDHRVEEVHHNSNNIRNRCY